MLNLVSPFEFIPSDLHLSAVVVTALACFLLIINVSSIKATSEDSKSEFPDVQSMPSTPVRGSATPMSMKTRLQNKLGSVNTPGGRRSARIAQKPKNK